MKTACAQASPSQNLPHLSAALESDTMLAFLVAVPVDIRRVFATVCMFLSFMLQPVHFQEDDLENDLTTATQDEEFKTLCGNIPQHNILPCHTEPFKYKVTVADKKHIKWQTNKTQGWGECDEWCANKVCVCVCIMRSIFLYFWSVWHYINSLKTVQYHFSSRFVCDFKHTSQPLRVALHHLAFARAAFHASCVFVCACALVWWCSCDRREIGIFHRLIGIGKFI